MAGVPLVGSMSRIRRGCKKEKDEGERGLKSTFFDVGVEAPESPGEEDQRRGKGPFSSPY